jgi:gpW protein
MTDKSLLEARLSEAETARHKLLLGKSATSTGFDGKQVTYQPTDLGQLNLYIRSLKIELGLPIKSRATQFRYC